jgi:polysaccharide export outer membrane protein
MRIGIISTALLALVAGLLPAQNSENTQNPKDTPESAAQATTSAAPTGPPTVNVGSGVDSKAYIIGAEDVLRIDVWREQGNSGVFVVRPDGKISLPLVGELQAAGRTPVQ